MTSSDPVRALADQWAKDASEMGELLPEGEVLTACAEAVYEALGDGIVFRRLHCSQHRAGRPIHSTGDPFGRHSWFDHDGAWWCPGVADIAPHPSPRAAADGWRVQRLPDNATRALPPSDPAMDFNGHCDTCGSPCDDGGCARDRSHAAALEHQTACCPHSWALHDIATSECAVRDCGCAGRKPQP